MNKIISINRRRPLAAYLNAQHNERSFEQAFLVVGAVLSIALPQFALSAYGGLVAFAACLGCGVAGVVWGAAIYRRSPYRVAVCVEKGSLPQAPPRKDATRRKAA